MPALRGRDRSRACATAKARILRVERDGNVTRRRSWTMQILARRPDGGDAGAAELATLADENLGPQAREGDPDDEPGEAEQSPGDRPELKLGGDGDKRWGWTPDKLRRREFGRQALPIEPADRAPGREAPGDLDESNQSGRKAAQSLAPEAGEDGGEKGQHDPAREIGVAEQRPGRSGDPWRLPTPWRAANERPRFAPTSASTTAGPCRDIVDGVRAKAAQAVLPSHGAGLRDCQCTARGSRCLRRTTPRRRSSCCRRRWCGAWP